MKTLLLTLLLVPMMSFGQNVNIPDANFKNHLLAYPNINTNGDSEIQVSEASAYTGWIYCVGENISDLTGIEAFTALTELRCGFNNLTSLDVSNNTALDYLSCYDNQLTSLDVSNNTALNWLNCADNYLECLNIKNGNNTAFSVFNVLGNPNLTCIEVNDVNSPTVINWINDNSNIDPQHYFSEDCNNACSNTSSISELNNTPKQLIKIVDVLGRETPFKPNTPLLYIYNDGTVERKMIIKE